MTQQKSPTNWPGFFRALLRGMKKYILLLSLIGLALTGRAQTQPAAYPTDAATGLIDYTETVAVADVSQAVLFTRAKLWLAGSFRSVKDVVQVEDKDAGVIVGRGYSPIGIAYFGQVSAQRLYYTLKLGFKDGKYKYELSDFYFENEMAFSQSFRTVKTLANSMLIGAANTSREEKVKGQYRAQFDATVPGLISSLKAGMLKSTDF